jgi:hypothetical protein
MCDDFVEMKVCFNNTGYVQSCLEDIYFPKAFFVNLHTSIAHLLDPLHI